MTSIYPLVSFRILFGLLMAFAGIRFVQNGWIERLFFEPDFFFKYYGFEWVVYAGDAWMYPIYALMIISALGIMLGLMYRASTILFFLTFCYTELIDATNYLNHHYLVAIFAFFLIFLPANKAISLDRYFGLTGGSSKMPVWCIDIIKAQIVIVYTCAGLAKLNPDWLLHGMPLSIWLPEHQDVPILGFFFGLPFAGLVMSWMGAIYDLSIGYLLLWKPTRSIAYALVVIFHLLTNLLFNIGLFPFIMIFSNVIFFSGRAHERLYEKLGLLRDQNSEVPRFHSGLTWFLAAFMVFQSIFPFRHWLYDGNVLWTEEGYRFSWRVMLVEKVGMATFKITDKESGRSSIVENGRYLTGFQEKQMSIQPDFILQYADFLAGEYRRVYGMKDVAVTADVNVALNTRTSRRLFDPRFDLARHEDSFAQKKWIMLAQR